MDGITFVLVVVVVLVMMRAVELVGEMGILLERVIT
jgi:hypothetical protein